MVCPGCGSENKDNAKFCFKCGFGFVPLNVNAERRVGKESVCDEEKDNEEVSAEIPDLSEENNEDNESDNGSSEFKAGRESVCDTVEDNKKNENISKDIKSNKESSTDKSDKNKDKIVTANEKKEKKNRVPIIILSVIIVLAVAAAGFFAVDALRRKSGKPGLLDKTDENVSDENRQDGDKFQHEIESGAAAAGTLITIPEIDENTDLQDLRKTLINMGFRIKTEAVVDKSVTEGTVISTDPASGESVIYGSAVTIYYATSDASKVVVPDVTGESLTAAKTELEELGFKVNVEYKDSDAVNSDKVIEQSIKADTTLIVSNTEITIVVGKCTVKQAAVSIVLPKISSNGKVYQTIYVFVGDELVKTVNNVELNGSSYNVTFEGSRKTTFKIYIGDQLVCSGNVDFTASPPAVTNKMVYQYNTASVTTPTTVPPTVPTTAAPTTAAPTTAAPPPTTEKIITLPSYSGKYYSDYYDEAVAAGFRKFTKAEMDSDLPAGRVIRVEAPQSTFTASEAASIRITIYVSKGPSGTTKPNSDIIINGYTY